jgi:hypothetical protein
MSRGIADQRLWLGAAESVWDPNPSRPTPIQRRTLDPTQSVRLARSEPPIANRRSATHQPSSPRPPAAPPSGTRRPMAGLPTIPRNRAPIPKLNHSTHLPVKREGDGTPITSNRGEEPPGRGARRTSDPGEGLPARRASISPNRSTDAL